MKIEIGVTGKIVRGNSLDVNRKAFEQSLRNLDPQLYLVWNPIKRSGMGCWEILRRPDKKKAVYRATHEGVNFFEITTNDKDSALVRELEHLHYRVIEDMASKDINRIFNRKPHESDEVFMERVYRETDYRQQQHQQAVMAKAHEESTYIARQHKKEIRELRELALSGFNLARVMGQWNKS